MQSDQQQGYLKRQQFRVEIRRKAVEQHLQQIREKWSKAHTNAYQDNKSPSESMNGKKHKHQVTSKIIIDKTTDNEYQQEYEQEVKQNTVDQEHDWGQEVIGSEYKQYLYKLHHLCLTDSITLCSLETLNYLTNILEVQSQLKKRQFSTKDSVKLSGNYLRLISQKVKQIVIRISVNQVYWSNQFLVQFVSFMKKLVTQAGIVRIPYLVECLKNVSESADPQLKFTSFAVIVNSQLIPAIVTQQYKCESETKTVTNGSCNVMKHKQDITAVIAHFIMTPPRINYYHHSLRQFVKLMSVSKLIEQVLDLLYLMVTPCNCRHQQLQPNNSSHILSIILNVCEIVHCMLVHPTNTNQSGITLKILQQTGWRIITSVLNTFNQLNSQPQSCLTLNSRSSQLICVSSSKTSAVKLKYKMLQIINFSIDHYLGSPQQGTLLEYLYAISPCMLPLIVGDLRTLCSRDLHKQQKSVFQQKYQTVLLRALLGMLIPRDPLGVNPTLEYLNVQYASTMPELFTWFTANSQFCTTGLIDVLVEVYSIMAQLNDDICCLSWANQFASAVLLLDCSLHPQYDGHIQQILLVLCHILNTHNHQNALNTCKLVVELSGQQIKSKLEHFSLCSRVDNCQNKHDDHRYNNDGVTNSGMSDLATALLAILDAAIDQVGYDHIT